MISGIFVSPAGIVFRLPDFPQEEMEEREFWAIAEPFSPLSSKQVLGYMKKKGYKIPLHRNTKKPTSNNESLQQLLKSIDDPVLDLVLDIRHLKKAESYLGEAMIGPDGRIHPLYSYVRTSRLASKRPNLMNLPQGRGSKIMEEAARWIRNSFLPDDGYVLVELDWRAIEPQLVGFFANDPDYMRVARLGSHAYVLSHDLGKPADLTKSDREVEAYLSSLKEAHPERYHTLKTANNAFNYRQGLYNMAKTLRKSVAETREIRDIISKAFPLIVKWQDDTLLRAHTDGRLTNPFGASMTFSNVLERDGKLGREANECLAFLPQSTGASMLRWVLVELFDHTWHGDIFKLLIPIHDAILLEVRKERVEEVVRFVKEVMERKWSELGGLSIEVEVKWGERMGEMRKWKN